MEVALIVLFVFGLAVAALSIGRLALRHEARLNQEAFLKSMSRREVHEFKKAA